MIDLVKIILIETIITIKIFCKVFFKFEFPAAYSAG
jgi:hypothetical protein